MFGIQVVTYNERDKTLRWLEAHRGMITQPGVRFLLLDNASADDTVAAVRQRFPEVEILRLNDNYGCVTGRNVGTIELERRGCRFMTALDNDIFVKTDGFVEKALRFFEEHPTVMAMCPVVYHIDEVGIQTAGGVLNALGRVRYVTQKVESHVHVLPGGAQVVRMEAFHRVGFYDNDLSPYGIEDLEWGVRARQRGVEMRNCPELEVVHRHDWSVKATPQRMAHFVETRTVFLRNYPTPANLGAEVNLAARLVLRYGPAFAARAYLAGLRKPLHPGNYEYEAFAGDYDFARYGRR